MSALARKLLLGFAVLGLAAAGASSYVHYKLLVEPQYSSFCDISGTVRCSEAYLSRYGSFAGVPVALGGVLFFVLVLLLLWASRGGAALAESAAAYIFTLSTLALAVVLYLAYASFFILKEVCPLCVTTYVAVAGVFIISGGASSLPMTTLPRRLVGDLGRAARSPLAFIMAILFLGGAATAIASFPKEGARPVVQQAPPLGIEQQSEVERWWNMQPKVQVPFSNDGAKVLILKFNDFQCPPCRQTFFAYEPILAQYKDRPADVKYKLIHFPLDPSCNQAVTSLVHPAACTAAAAYVMASQLGTSDKLEGWLFDNQEKLSPATVRDAAADVAGIKDFDQRLPAAIQQVKTDASIGGMLGVNQTPTFFINGRKIAGGVDPRVFQAVIDLELRNASKQ